MSDLTNMTLAEARDAIRAKKISSRELTGAFVSAIEKAIRTSGTGLNPMSDGTVVRVPVPPMTEERRKDVVKQLNKTLEDHNTAIRNIRRDGNERER